MAIFDKAKEKFQGFMQGGEQANRNRRSNAARAAIAQCAIKIPPSRSRKFRRARSAAA